MKDISTRFWEGGETERQHHHCLMLCKPKETRTYTATPRRGPGEPPPTRSAQSVPALNRKVCLHRELIWYSPVFTRAFSALLSVFPPLLIRKVRMPARHSSSLGACVCFILIVNYIPPSPSRLSAPHLPSQTCRCQRLLRNKALPTHAAGLGAACLCTSPMGRRCCSGRGRPSTQPLSGASLREPQGFQQALLQQVFLCSLYNLLFFLTPMCNHVSRPLSPNLMAAYLKNVSVCGCACL